MAAALGMQAPWLAKSAQLAATTERATRATDPIPDRTLGVPNCWRAAFGAAAPFPGYARRPWNRGAHGVPVEDPGQKRWEPITQ